MLCISRRPGERIVFPELDITVVVEHRKGRTIQLNIDAPRDIKILRGELVDQDQDKGRKDG